jgi:hypothetical protein
VCGIVTLVRQSANQDESLRNSPITDKLKGGRGAAGWGLSADRVTSAAMSAGEC